MLHSSTSNRLPSKGITVPSLLLLNARSIAAEGKLDDLTLSCSTLHPDFCVVTETWLNDSHDSSYFQMPNYFILRKDRIGKAGGGVAIWVRNGINCSVLPTLDFPSFVDCLCLSFRYGCKDYILCAIYHPPNTGANNCALVLDAIIETIDKWSNRHCDGEVIIAGDLNDLDVDCLSRVLDLVKKVVAPTRGHSILDHFLVSSSLNEHYPEADVGPPLSTSRRGSHGQVFLKPHDSHGLSIKNRYYSVLDLRKPNVDAFLEKLSTSSFHDIYKTNDINMKVSLFYDTLNRCLSCIPKTTVYMTPRDKPWMNPHLKNLVNLRWKAYRSRDFAEYNRLKCATHEAIKHAKKKWIERASDSANKLWKTVNEFSGKRTGSPLDPILSQHPDIHSALNHLNLTFTKYLALNNRLICLWTALTGLL